jgi:two-component system chemotaxis response regulator CheB
MRKTRVIIAEDSPTVRHRLVEILESDPDIEVVANVGDGKQAIEACQKLRPDVITMDMMMPVMTGLAATEYIMAHCPTPILIVSASVNRGELFRTYDALAAGAVDVLDKPNGKEPDGEWERRFVSTLKLVSRIKVITHPRARLKGMGTAVPAAPSAFIEDVRAGKGEALKLVALGASTGGPGAIVEVLRGLPSGFPLPVLLVLHINEPFGSAFADWLDAQTTHRVSHATGGELLEAAGGRIIMAPGHSHMIVRDGRIRLTKDAERHSCRPSVDVLFESIARDRGANALACLLTGMGRDGAQGLLDIRKSGGITIAQDEASSVIYGMPREAAAIGAAQHILPLSDIGAAIAALAGASSSGRPA